MLGPEITSIEDFPAPTLESQSVRVKELRAKVLDLLSRREHSRGELRGKLIKRGWPEELVEPVLDEFCSAGYLDDERFAEQFVLGRLGKLWGVQRYLQELKLRGVDFSGLKDRIATLLHEHHVCRSEKLSAYVRSQRATGRPEGSLRSSLIRRGYSWTELQDLGFSGPKGTEGSEVDWSTH